MGAEGSRFRVIHSPYVPVCDAQGRSQSRIQPYPPMVGPCRLCPARCCHTSVKASIPDVIHYCATLDLPFFAGFTFEHSTNEKRGLRLDPDARFLDPEDGWTGFGEIRLRRREGGGCANLVELGGYLRCGAYDARPSNCRLYPVTWEDERGQGSPGAVLCPAPYAVTPDEARAVQSSALRAREFWDVHEAVVGEWNAHPAEDRSLETALPYVLERAAVRLQRPLPEVLLVSGTPEERLTEALRERGMIPPGPAVLTHEQRQVFAGLPTKGRPL